jgi:heme oxygenase
MAHIYVRHMGDLAGGQMIAKRVPGAGRLYKFEEPDALKEAIRARINDDLAEEANICFDFAIRMFKELMDLDMPKLKESIDE